jgi:ABC-2 type transport system ATP-binding protein
VGESVLICCEGVSKKYRNRVAVKDVNLRIGGGICALLGPNGAGKSTLLNMMTGLEVPDAGSIKIDELDVVRDSQRVRQSMGVLPDRLGLFESLTVLENLLCAGPIYGLSAAETRARSNALLTLLDLEAGRDTFAKECSYGMRKKTALAMALLHGPKVLFLDEPFEGIDPSSSRAIETLLVRAARQGVAIVLTSHILPLVERLASRMVMLGGGGVVWDSDDQKANRGLEEVYFEVVGETAIQELPWFG